MGPRHSQAQIRNLDVIDVLRPGSCKDSVTNRLKLREHITEKEVRSMFTKNGILKYTLGKAHKGWQMQELEQGIASLLKILKCPIARTAMFKFFRRTGLFRDVSGICVCDFNFQNGIIASSYSLICFDSWFKFVRSYLSVRFFNSNSMRASLHFRSHGIHSINIAI